MWNPESWALESGIQHKESGIPLTIVIQNPSSTDKGSRIQYLESVIHSLESSRVQRDCLGLTYMGNPESIEWNPESRAVLDSLASSETFK